MDQKPQKTDTTMKQLRKLNVLIIIFIYFVFSSCNSQSNVNVEILGNWQVISHSDLTELLYTEIFFNDRYLITYNEMGGLTPASKYFIKEGDMIITYWADDKQENIGRVSIVGDLLKFTGEEHEFVYKKIDESPNLGEYNNAKIVEGIFRAAFFARMNQWKKGNRSD